MGYGNAPAQVSVRNVPYRIGAVQYGQHFIAEGALVRGVARHLHWSYSIPYRILRYVRVSTVRSAARFVFGSRDPERESFGISEERTLYPRYLTYVIMYGGDCLMLKDARHKGHSVKLF